MYLGGRGQWGGWAGSKVIQCYKCYLLLEPEAFMQTFEESCRSAPALRRARSPLRGLAQDAPPSPSHFDLRATSSVIKEKLWLCYDIQC